MKVKIFPQNHVIVVGASRVAFQSIINSLGPAASLHEFNTLEELKKIASDEWYRCLKVGIRRNPYDLAVSLHFWYQQSINPKSMTLSTSVQDPRWKEIFNDALRSMILLDYDDVICFENLRNDLQRIQSVFGFPLIKAVQTQNMTRPEDTREDYRSLYDRRSRTAVTRMSRKILDEYGYSF